MFYKLLLSNDDLRVSQRLDATRGGSLPLKDGPLVVLERGKSLADIAYDEMLELIRSGTWQPRSRLPSEADLCRRFGMSRPILRQALARLRREGLIKSRQGSGSFVIGAAERPEIVRPAVPVANFPAITSVADLQSFMIFREGVEAEAAAMAAIRRTAAQLVELRHAAGRLQVSVSPNDLSEDDYAFHLAIARASGNPFSVNTVTALRDHLILGLGLLWSFAGDGATSTTSSVSTMSGLSTPSSDRTPTARARPCASICNGADRGCLEALHHNDRSARGDFRMNFPTPRRSLRSQPASQNHLSFRGLALVGPQLFRVPAWGSKANPLRPQPASEPATTLNCCTK